MSRFNIFHNMTREIEDSTWGKEDVRRLNDFEKDRNLVLRATKQILLNFCKQNFQGNERVLEVGSGTGFMKRNWPKEFQGEYIQLDSQPAFLKVGKTKNFNEVYVGGSAYELPFPDESLDVVCGYGSYDVLMDLETAIKEANRVLKKGGLFFHMLDLYPCGSPIIKDLEKRQIPLQIKEHGEYDGCSQIESISFIPEEEIERFNQAGARIKDDKLGLDGFENIIKQHNRLWNKYAQKIRPHDYFSGKMLQTLLNSDFKNVESGKMTARFKGERTGQQRQRGSEPFLFFHDAGGYYKLRNLVPYDLLHLNFPDMLNVLPFYHETAYRLIKRVSPSLANKIEPSCLEVSAIKYVKARKGSE